MSSVLSPVRFYTNMCADGAAKGATGKPRLGGTRDSLLPMKNSPHRLLGSDADLSENVSSGGEIQTHDALSIKSLAAFEGARSRAGIVYISRIPPAMRPSKVRHLMGGFGIINRVYLQQEDPRRVHLRRQHTSTKKTHFTEGWVEFMDKRVARAVAEMLNGQPIGGKKGTRFRDDVWTLKYLPRFKWNMLTEQIAHESATRTARLRVELSQSHHEQQEYLKNVEVARILAKRERKRAGAPMEHEDWDASCGNAGHEETKTGRGIEKKTRQKEEQRTVATSIDDVLSDVF